jgi:hypothetical protein
MSQAPKEYHLVDLLTGESLGGFVTLAAAREEARAVGLARWEFSRAMCELSGMIQASRTQLAFPRRRRQLLMKPKIIWQY